MNQSTSATTAAVPRAEAIARLNDQLRTTGTGGTIVVTQGVLRITGYDPVTLAAALANYDGFDADNDPYGERDFGDLVYQGWDLLWKVDYFDLNHQFGSDDPADPAKTSRVLTVMLASEW